MVTWNSFMKRKGDHFKLGSEEKKYKKILIAIELYISVSERTMSY